MLFALPLLLVLGVFLPLLGCLGVLRAQAKDDSEATIPTIRDIVVQLGILQTIVAGLAMMAFYGTGIEIAWLSVISLQTVLIALAALGCVLILSLLEARRPLGPNEHVRARLRNVSAGNPAWIGVTIYAGIIEEFAYRGVLTLILADTLGYWPAAALSAALFGLAHLSSGWRAAPNSAVFALAMQFIVFVSGGLLMAVAVHIIYDLLAAWLGQNIVKRQNDKSAA